MPPDDRWATLEQPASAVLGEILDLATTDQLREIIAAARIRLDERDDSDGAL